MKADRLYIGTYTHDGSKGIYLAEFSDGALRLAGHTEADNPSYLAFHDSTLYAVRETKSGGVSSYRAAGDGTLTLSGSHPVLGDAPCHVCASGGFLYVSNYLSGTLTVFALDERGDIAPPARVIAHEGNGSHLARQAAPHVHQSAPSPDGTYLAVCDLGIDEVVFYPLREREVGLPGERISAPPGSGPRHLVFGRDEIWYLVCELSCMVLVYQGYGRRARLVQTLPTLENEGTGSFGAAIRLSPDGRLLLASVRGENTLALFSVQSDGSLAAPKVFGAGGGWPRDAAFSPDGRFVLCACEQSHRITVFSVETGALRYLSSTPCPSPACLCFAPARP